MQYFVHAMFIKTYLLFVLFLTSDQYCKVIQDV
uniref:Uncharacterized protein n=1 Tax=Anguilla anguilla TaxID=7936 RepID=A0A0E9W2V0_ANGAN